MPTKARSPVPISASAGGPLVLGPLLRSRLRAPPRHSQPQGGTIPQRRRRDANPGPHRLPNEPWL